MILKFKMFEGMEYESISLTEEEYNDLDWENKVDFSKSEKNKLRKFFASKNISIMNALKYIDQNRSYKSLFFSKRIGGKYINISIHKMEDDWFVVRILGRDLGIDESQEYYKCDQFDGLIQCLEKNFSDIPDQDPNILINKEDGKLKLDDLRRVVYKKIRLLSFDELTRLNQSLG